MNIIKRKQQIHSFVEMIDDESELGMLNDHVNALTMYKPDDMDNLLLYK